MASLSRCFSLVDTDRVIVSRLESSAICCGPYYATDNVAETKYGATVGLFHLVIELF